MTTTRTRLLRQLDRTLSILLASIIFGTTLAFGGAVWWGRGFVVGSTFLIALTWFVRCGVSGRWPVLWSPLTLLGSLAIGLAVAQLVPWPSPLAALLSPKARAVHSLGVLPDLARSDDPSAVIPEPFTSRSPLTLDRAATLRWLVGASACLALFWITSHYTDRFGRLSLIWGSVAAGFIVNGAIIAVQLSGQVNGLYGFIEPGKGPFWAPSTADVLEAPGRTVLRSSPASGDERSPWAFASPVASPWFGTMQGGADAFLALGSLALPICFALTLQLMAPRGSREPLWSRLSLSGRGSLLVLLYVSTILCSFLVGLFTGRSLVWPFLAGLLAVGLPCLVGTGMRGKAFVLTLLTVGSLGGGLTLGDSWRSLFAESLGPPRASTDWKPPRPSGMDWPILRDFPLVGVGLGAYSSATPYYKETADTSTTAESTLAQWSTESGLAGLAVLGLALFWGLVRLPIAIARVGSGDRALAFGFVGTALCFFGYATMRWTVESAAVAVAASVFAGTMNRWLSGGTDLLVEPSDA